MRLRDLIQGLAVRAPDAVLDAEICAVTDDSREVVPGALFVARQGVHADGRRFLDAALASGASAVAMEPRPGESPPKDAPILVTPDAALLLAVAAERFHGSPTSAMQVVGVTGTNGKTTVCFLVRAILEEAGLPCGLVSTVRIDAGSKSDPIQKATMTTPGAAPLAAMLGRIASQGCKAVALETSSHALEQKRVAGVRYAAAVFTNLTGDHLDYHGDMASYADAKAKLFEGLAPEATAIVNADEPWSERMLRDCRAKIVLCTAGAPMLRLRNAKHASAQALGASRDGTDLSLTGPWGEARFVLPLIGAHNVMNALQAAAAAHALGADRVAIERALSKAAAPPGRLQPVTRAPNSEEPVSVYVDYAHTDDALERSLRAVRATVAPGRRLWLVFGCGGDRDRTKRPRMGEVAGRLADVLVVTSDNPRTEDPRSIIEQVLAGVPAKRRDEAEARAEPDRERAIAGAVREAEAGDVILIAGKGHEDYQILPDGKGGTVRRDFDDVLVARAALTERHERARRGGGAAA